MSIPNAKALVVQSFGSKTFKASRRTFAHLAYTAKQLAKRYPKASIHIMQGCYNTGVQLSKGTHDFDSVVDVRIDGLDWWLAQDFMRSCGWAAWFRHTGSWSASRLWHLHCVSLGYATKVGIYVPGQVADYYNHTMGLKNQHNVVDHSWFPLNISATIFDFQRWEIEMEDILTPEQMDQLATMVKDKVLKEIVPGAGNGKHAVKNVLAATFNDTEQGRAEMAAK